ncbi:zinc transporter ZIP9-A-like [Amblyraja radiata]|uniref:zinc transporter ZIP9-A-like n=1 Tax=Amblyraja radiata TaxID=386614 RepID=UPI0014020453|nr:zinc transporter ZIP9-A-like [Amblyraja radiata]
MDGALSIALLSLAMFGGSLLLGLIPLLVRLPEARLRQVSVLGAGLLCGTALAVVIPEGIELLMAAPPSGRLRNLSLDPVTTESPAGAEGRACAPSHVFIGIALVTGFLLMFLIDQITACITGQGQGQGEQGRGARSRTGLTATLGLVIHAAVDGVALGTAAGSSQVSLQVIVFLAVILHKAPASFGLVSYLLHMGLERRQIYRHLLAFSLAAPLLALTTFFIVRQSSLELLQQTKATGVGLLFSAGTFLYVASVHVLPEVSGQRPHPEVEGRLGLGLLDSLTMVLGCTLPVLLSLGLHNAQ